MARSAELISAVNSARSAKVRAMPVRAASQMAQEHASAANVAMAMRFTAKSLTSTDYADYAETVTRKGGENRAETAFACCCEDLIRFPEICVIGVICGLFLKQKPALPKRVLAR